MAHHRNTHGAGKVSALIGTITLLALTSIGCSDALSTAQAEPLTAARGDPTVTAATEIRFSGILVYIDAKMIRVNGQEQSVADDMSFLLSDRTVVTLAGKPATLQDLALGMGVVVHSEPDGRDAVATRIDASPL